MAEPNEKFKDLDYLLTRIGLPAVMCIGLLWFLKYEWTTFKQENRWYHERILRNTRSLMQDHKIPVIIDGEPQK